MEININERVKVNLTEYGKKIYSEHYEQFWSANSIYRPEKLPDMLETELWNLMQIFGDCLFMGNPEIPFVDNKIILFGTS